MQYNAWHCLLFAVIINFYCNDAVKAQFDIAVRLIKAKTSFNGNHSTNLSKITNWRIPLFYQNYKKPSWKRRIIDKITIYHGWRPTHSSLSINWNRGRDHDFNVVLKTFPCSCFVFTERKKAVINIAALGGWGGGVAQRKHSLATFWSIFFIIFKLTQIFQIIVLDFCDKN